MGKQWPVKPSQKCRAGSIPAYPEKGVGSIPTGPDQNMGTWPLSVSGSQK